MILALNQIMAHALIKIVSLFRAKKIIRSHAQLYVQANYKRAC